MFANSLYSAISNADFRYKFLMFLSAPFINRRLTILVLPYAVARSRAVWPSLSFISMRKLTVVSKYATASSLPLQDAQ